MKLYSYLVTFEAYSRDQYNVLYLGAVGSVSLMHDKEEIVSHDQIRVMEYMLKDSLDKDGSVPKSAQLIIRSWHRMPADDLDIEVDNEAMEKRIKKRHLGVVKE